MPPEATTETKSIINAKYKDRYKEPDWLGEVINDHCTKTHTVEVSLKDKDGKLTGKTETKAVKDGIDVEALNELATANGIDPAPYSAMNVGQQRMNIGNRLRSLTLKRHGLYVDGKWVLADTAWLKAKGAPDAPTHDRDGTAFAKAKVEAKPAKEPAKEMLVDKKPAKNGKSKK